VSHLKVAIASDHAGFDLKQFVVTLLSEQAEIDEVQDLGTDSHASCDYPDFAVAVARTVASGGADWGILICGTGVGMSVAANKIPGIVAALCADCYTARMAREHNDANILCMGGRVIGPGVAEDIVLSFMHTEPITAQERYTRRREKVSRLDDRTATEQT
jgi:ribose 5-phosphate isomerase B